MESTNPNPQVATTKKHSKKENIILGVAVATTLLSFLFDWRAVEEKTGFNVVTSEVFHLISVILVIVMMFSFGYYASMSKALKTLSAVAAVTITIASILDIVIAAAGVFDLAEVAATINAIGLVTAIAAIVLHQVNKRKK